MIFCQHDSTEFKRVFARAALVLASGMKISSKLHASGELKFSSAQPTLLSRRRLADHASVTMRYLCNPRHPCET